MYCGDGSRKGLLLGLRLRLVELTFSFLRRPLEFIGRPFSLLAPVSKL